MMRHKKFLLEQFLAAAAAATLFAGCAEQLAPDADEFYGQRQEAEVEDPIPYTPQNYDFTGDMPIADLLDLYPNDEFVWYGFAPSDKYPQGDDRIIDADCDPGQYDNVIESIDELPARIEGVVTLHPRYFQKVSVCGQDQRFYGSYFIQDSSGGMLILKDGRIPDFDYGDRVSLRVRGIMTSFGQPSVLVWDEQEVVNPGETLPIYYDEISREFETGDVGEVKRIVGTIVDEPTNDNFNALTLEGDDGATWGVSIDRELGTRPIEFNQGDRMQFTGPVANSYGLTLVVGRLGQIEWLDEE